MSYRRDPATWRGLRSRSLGSRFGLVPSAISRHQRLTHFADALHLCFVERMDLDAHVCGVSPLSARHVLAPRLMNRACPDSDSRNPFSATRAASMTIEPSDCRVGSVMMTFRSTSMLSENFSAIPPARPLAGATADEQLWTMRPAIATYLASKHPTRADQAEPVAVSTFERRCATRCCSIGSVHKRLANGLNSVSCDDCVRVRNDQHLGTDQERRQR